MSLMSCMFYMVLVLISMTDVLPMVEAKEKETQVAARKFDAVDHVNLLMASRATPALGTGLGTSFLAYLLEGGEDSLGVSVARIITKTLLTLGAAQTIYVLVDDFILMPLGIDLNIRRKRRNLNEGWNFDEETLRNVINSIDPVGMSFSFMKINEIACRNKAICEVSSTPWIAKFIRYMSPTVWGLEEYKDAVDLGEALADCSLIFAECQKTVF